MRSIGALCVTAALWIRPCQALEGPAEQAEALVNYAETLGKSGEVVIVGEEGLTVAGEKLSGRSVIRPSLALSRAAELYMEAAAEKNDIQLVDRAFKIWDVLGDSQSPVGYLRTYRLSKKLQNPAFATYCTVRLANCYTQQGDTSTAKELLVPYAKEISVIEAIALAKATYAECLLAEGNIDGARPLAQEVLDKVPRADYSYEVSNAYNVALKVIVSIPSLSKAGTVTANANEATMLKEMEGNPQQYFQLANTMNAAGDKQKAIYYWDEYRKRFPADVHARTAAMNIGKAWEELKNTEKAVECYRGIFVQYPDAPQGWNAALRTSEILIQDKKTKEAFAVLEQAARYIKTAQGQAWILVTQAQLFIQNQMLDEAAEKYMGLLIKYGDQDAAKDALANLKKVIPQVKKWKNFTQILQNWLLGKYGRAGQTGNTQINLSDASQLRRLALSFYVENSEISGGITWLKALGLRSEEKERNWFIRDEAWFNAQCAQKAVSIANKVPKQEMPNMVKLGLTAWQIAPETEEGLAGLQASTALVLTAYVDKQLVKQYTRDVEKLRGGDSDAMIVDMLIKLYEANGEEKKLKALRDAATRL